MADLVSTIDRGIIDEAFVQAGQVASNSATSVRIFGTAPNVSISGTPFDIEFEVLGQDLLDTDLDNVSILAFRFDLGPGGEFTLEDISISGQDFVDALDAGKISALAKVALDRNDDIKGGAGDDLLFGFQGNDDIIAGGGDDLVRAGQDNDLVKGGGGDDRLIGQGGADTLIGASGVDTLVGGGGDDLLRGGADNDVLRAAVGEDTVVGGGGDDRLLGQGGDDELRGGGGADNLSGGDANDVLKAGGGADTLSGDLGDDTLIGGGGDDLLVFTDNDGADLVQGFRTGQDVIDLSGVSAIIDFADLTANHLSSQGGDAVIDTDGGSIRLDGVAVADLAATDFLF